MSASQAASRWRGVLGLVVWAWCIAALAAQPRTPPLTGLQLHPAPERSAVVPAWRSDGPLPPAWTVALEPGFVIDGATLHVAPAQPGGAWRVQVQFETSLSLTAGGPHLDLTEWKHCISDWVAADPVDDVTFVLPAPSPDMQGCFPDYTPAELDAAVRAHLRDDPDAAVRWLDGLRGPPDAAEVAPIVDISAIRVRVAQRQAGRWVQIAEVTFQMPLGC